MQYINVSQFYESILCFSIPLLIVQRAILIFLNIGKQYEDYRALFYESQFQKIKDYEYRDIEKVLVQPGQAGQKQEQNNIKEEMLDHNEKSQYRQYNESQVQGREIQKSLKQGAYLENNISDTVVIQAQKINNGQIIQENFSQISPGNQKNDKQLKNHITKQEMTLQYTIKAEPLQRESHKVTIQEIQQSEMAAKQALEVRRQTQLDQEPSKVQEDHQEVKQKQTIQLGRGQLLQQGINQKMMLKYCRRIDDAFNEYVPIMMCLIVLGILTQSVYIFSMCCFFGFAFASLLFNYGNLLEKLEGERKESFFEKTNKLISSLFIIGLFISYWVSSQFY